MPMGPWINGKDDSEYAIANPWDVGSLIEFETKDPAGDACNVLVVLVANGPKERTYSGHFVAASEKSYTDWMLKHDSHPMPGLFRRCVLKGDEREKKIGGEKVIHINRARIVCQDGDPISLAACKWLKPRNNTRATGITLDILKSIERLFHPGTLQQPGARGIRVVTRKLATNRFCYLASASSLLSVRK